MPDPNPVDYAALPTPPNSVLKEQGIEEAFIQKLVTLKNHYRTDIRDRAALEANFREKFEALNHVRLTDADCPARTTRSHPAESERSDRQFARLLDEIVTATVFKEKERFLPIYQFAESVPNAHHDLPLHGAHRQRAKATHHVALSGLCGEADRDCTTIHPAKGNSPSIFELN